MKTKILDLIDFEKVDILLEGFNKSTGFVTAILDLDGNILSKSGWRQACTAFHRVNPETSKKCTISDTTLASKMGKNESYHFYQCLNGLVDVSVPIVIGNEHIANLFSGQFFFEEPDKEYFKKQAQKYGFDEENYLKSISEVPVLSKDKVIAAMDFLLNMTQMISEISFQKLEQMQLNEAVKTSERTLRLFVEYSPASIAMFDNNMCYLIASRRFLTDYNLGDRNIVGLSHYEVFPEIPERWKEIHKRALKGEIISADNDPFPRTNGEMDWIRWEIRPWFRNDMEIGGIILFSEVITEYKKSEQALIDSQAYNRTLFEQSVIGLALTGMDGKLVDINPAYAIIIGRTVEETKQLTYWDITPEKYNLKEQEQLKLLEKTGRYGPYEKEYIHKNGNLVPVRLKGQIIERAGEKYIWSSVEDISEQKQAEEELKLSEKKYRYLFNNNPLPMWIYNLETLAFMEVNEAAILHYGYSEAEFKSMTIRDIRPEEEVGLLLEDVADTYKSYNKAGIWQHRKKNGEIISVEIVSHLIDFENIPARLVLANDVTNRMEAEEALKESEKRYRSLFENMNAGFVLFEVCQNKQGIPIDLIVAAANEGFEETTGLKLRNAIGSKLTEVLPGIEKDDADWIGTYSKVAITGEAIQFEQGSELLGYYYSVSAFKAGPKQCAVTFVDITERKLAEELNRKSAERAKMQRNLIARLTFEESVFNRDVDDALKIITSKLAQIMQVDRVSVWLLSDDNTKLQRRMLYDAAFGSDSQIEVLETADISSYFEALRNDSQIDAEDAQNDSRTRGLNKNYFIPLQITSLLDSAIQQDGQLIGVLSVEHRGPIRKWETDEKSFLSAATNLISQLFTDAKRKKTEEKLKESEARFRKLYEDGASGMVMADKGFKFLMANRTFCEMIGYPEEKLQQLTFADITHPDDKARDFSQAKKMMTGEIGVYRTEKRYIKKDGQTIWAQLTVSPIHDSINRFQYFVGIIVDITERKIAEMELAESEERLRLATDRANIAVWEYDFITNTMSRSQNHDKLYGLHWQDKWDITTFLNATHHDDREYSNDFIMNAVASGGSDDYSFDFRVVFPDNSIRWLLVHGRVIERSENGQGLKVRGTLIDITEQKNKEEEIKKLNQRLEILVDSIQLLSSAQLLDDVEDIVAKSARKLIGADGATLVFREGDQCFYVNEDAIQPLWKGKKFPINTCISGWVIENKKPVVINDIFTDDRIPKDLYSPTFVKSLAMVPVNISEPIGAIGNYWKERYIPTETELQLLQTLADAAARTIENIKLYTELEDRVKRRTEQLQIANKELETFTYSVSHDLKAPLRGIDGYSKLLLNEYGNSLNEEASHFIKTIRSSTLHMNQLIEDLLAYSRLERSNLKSERIELRSLLKTLVSDLSDEIKNGGITVELNIHQVHIVTDSRGLSIVLRNLLENAIKFTRDKPKPRIEINWEKKNAFGIISVKDNGVGFDMKYHNRIFEIFQRLHRSEDFPGTGIGLAMVAKAVQRMNGKVWAESSLGEGATFFVELPN